jgi:hypothetical protein
MTVLKPTRIESAEAIGPTRLRIAWTTRGQLEVDLADPMAHRQPIQNKQPGNMPGCLVSRPVRA